jgi:hypothetical protein
MYNLCVFGAKTPYKKLNEAQQLFLEDLVLLATKGFFPLEHMLKYLDAEVCIKVGSKTCFPISKDIV